MTPDTLTTEQQLAAVIEAQVKGGFDENSIAIRIGFKLEQAYVVVYGMPALPCHILEILLEPRGLKAAHREYPDGLNPEEYRMTGLRPWDQDCGHHILTAWLSKPDGDPEAAIRTAYNLLPRA